MESHTHTLGGGGLLDLPCTKGQLLCMQNCSAGPLNAKKISSPKMNLFGLHVHVNTSGTVAGSEASPLHLQADPRLTLPCHTSFCGFFIFYPMV